MSVGHSIHSPHYPCLVTPCPRDPLPSRGKPYPLGQVCLNYSTTFDIRVSKTSTYRLPMNFYHCLEIFHVGIVFLFVLYFYLHMFRNTVWLDPSFGSCFYIDPEFVTNDLIKTTPCSVLAKLEE